MPAPPCQLRQRAHLPRLPRRAGGRGAERAPPRRADHAGHDPRRGQPRVCAPARARPALPPGAPDRRAEPRARPRHARHQLHPVVHGLQRAADRAGGRARRGRAPGRARGGGGVGSGASGGAAVQVFCPWGGGRRFALARSGWAGRASWRLRLHGLQSACLAWRLRCIRAAWAAAGGGGGRGCGVGRRQPGLMRVRPMKAAARARSSPGRPGAPRPSARARARRHPGGQVRAGVCGPDGWHDPGVHRVHAGHHAVAHTVPAGHERGRQRGQRARDRLADQLRDGQVLRQRGARAAALRRVPGGCGAPRRAAARGAALRCCCAARHGQEQATTEAPRWR